MDNTVYPQHRCCSELHIQISKVLEEAHRLGQKVLLPIEILYQLIDRLVKPGHQLVVISPPCGLIPGFRSVQKGYQLRRVNLCADRLRLVLRSRIEPDDPRIDDAPQLCLDDMLGYVPCGHQRDLRFKRLKTVFVDIHNVCDLL